MLRSDRAYTKDEVMGLMEPLVSTWFDERFDRLSDPQSKAVPIIHERKNVLVSSPTGSGKTLTAFMSIINELVRYDREGTLEERIYCIYISPLKALANDINRNLNTPLKEMKEVAEANGMKPPGIKVAVRSGDTSQYERQKMLKHPPHILITTPESLALILEAPKFREKLTRVEWLILDEIHDICDSKRGAFLSLTIERLQELCENRFTRIGLSATLAPMEAIAGFLGGYENGEPREVTLVESDTKKQLDLRVICPTEDMTTLPSDIVNSMMYDTLKELVDAHETTLVFTNTRSGAESVVYKLKERGLDNIEVHHSSLGKETRLDVEERLKAGEIKCVVSSTSLELGIDIGSVDLVCQIGSPKSVAKGLQRVGRSGHSMGKVAKGRLLVFDPDDLVECAVMCRAAHRGDIDRVGIPENPLDVLAQTVVGMSLGARWNVDDAYRLVTGSYCYRNLTKESFISVLRYLGSKDEYEGVYSKIWYDEEEGVFGRKRGARMIYYLNLGTIPEEANYRVITGHGSVAGELSEKFVERLAPKDIFVLGGRSFEFVRSKGMSAYVKEASGRKPTVPSWAGEMLPRSFDLSMDIARFRGEAAGIMEDQGEDELMDRLVSDFDIDEGSAKSIISYFREQKAVAGMIPDDKTLSVEEYIDPSGNQRIVFHFPFGRRVNDALSRGYAYKISNITGANASVTMSDDSFMIGTSRKIDVSRIPGMLSSKELETILRKAVRNSEIFKLRFRHTAARSFMILRNYQGRPISVNRQQTRSSYLLDALGDMENMPVIEETYREVLEDDMDIKNARVILESLDAGTMRMAVQPFTGTPSPFAHSIILSGFSDIVLMEDRSALLRELHRKVLYRALGDAVKEFEFEEDQIVPYFREKIGSAADRPDIVPLLMRTGPLQALRERGRNIYAYCDADKKTVDAWVRELIEEGALGTVFLDEAYVMPSEEIPYYASATRKERDLTAQDRAVLDAIGDRTALTEISEAAELDSDTVYRSVRKLESMYLVTRAGVTANNRWYFKRYEGGFPNPEESCDRVISRHLECFAPATVKETAFALSMPESAVSTSLESMTASGEVVRGRFLISEGDQYMLKIDHMRLRSGKENVFDYDSIEKYRASKGRRFPGIREFFEFYEFAGSEIDVFSRVDGFDLREWNDMRSAGEIRLGRFARGRVRFILEEDARVHAALRRDEPVADEDMDLLSVIRGMGTATLRQLVKATGREKESVRDSLMRLDRALLVVRGFDGREDWGTENRYEAYERPSEPDEGAVERAVMKAVRAYGPIPPTAMRFIMGISPDAAAGIASRNGAKTILVGDGQTPMLVMSDEVPLIREDRSPDTEVRLLTLHDPDLASKWAELAARYGDRWIYPLVRGNAVIGAMEIWEMSGCIEVRAIDLDDPEDLTDALGALDKMMAFFAMKGTDIVRVREILSKDASECDPVVAGTMDRAGYVPVNGFYAKGRFVPRTFEQDELFSYVLSKQRVQKGRRFRTVGEAVSVRGYVRNDSEIFSRVDERTTIKKQADALKLVRTSLIPAYIGYTTLETASLYRAAKGEETDEDMRTVLAIIRDRQPVNRKAIINASPLSMERTAEGLNNLSRASAIAQNPSGGYVEVPDNGMGHREALREATRKLFLEFGIFSAELLSYFVQQRKMHSVRDALADLEDEGFLCKGFFEKDSPTVYWMLSADAGGPVPAASGFTILNTQDNLHVYLRHTGRTETSLSVVFKGTEPVGTFKGRITSEEAKVEDFKGTDEAFAALKDMTTSMGVRIDTGEKEDDDDKYWDASEFYLKMNPGAKKQI